MHAVLFGAVGDPRIEVGKLEFAIIAGLRHKLDLFVNLRPIKLYHESLCPLKGKQPEHIDMMFCRENTEDAYAGIYGATKKGSPDEISMQQMLYTRKGTERIIRYAFELAKQRGPTGGRSKPRSLWSTRPTRFAPKSCGRGRSVRSQRSIQASTPTTPTSTRRACSW